uniref:Uncharacterized protein n=1 Tax=Cannabis sativa TaxID=3483 RepID=A0A803NKJ9_CANSA
MALIARLKEMNPLWSDLRLKAVYTMDDFLDRAYGFIKFEKVITQAKGSNGGKKKSPNTKAPATEAQSSVKNGVASRLEIVIGGPHLAENSRKALERRPTLYNLRAISSVYHLFVKFPTSTSIGCLLRNQGTACECYNASLSLAKKTSSAATTSEGTNMTSLVVITPRGTRVGPIKKLKELFLKKSGPTKVVKIGTNVMKVLSEMFMAYLKRNEDIFAWSHEDMIMIDPQVICNAFNIDKVNFKPIQQKHRLLDKEHSKALKEEVERLQENNFIREDFYTVWVSNPILVPKPNGKWRTCVDFTDLNKAFHKNYFLLPRTDQLVDVIASHELLTFMGAYSGYNQINMHVPDEEHTSF